jgi:hypothetical protein
MKNIILLIIAIVFSIGCSAQTKVSKTVNIKDWNGDTEAYAYYKDIDNDLDAFVGTWVHTDGNTSLKIVLKKEIKSIRANFYEDFLIGEYQYIENGVEKINTLPQLNTILKHQRTHEISGNDILENHNIPICDDCLPNEKRLDLKFSDPIRQLGGDLILRKIIVDGKPALKAFKRTTIRVISIDEMSPYKEMLVPSGYYTLIKQ